MFERFVMLTTKHARYICGDMIGRGSFGKVYRCVDLLNQGTPLAIKIMSKYRSYESYDVTIGKIDNEVRALKNMSKCKYVAQFIDSYEDEDSVKIVMEYCSGGDLNSYVEKYGTLTEPQLATVAFQILTMLKYCQEYGIVFADIKPANFCLLDPFPNLLTLKAIDFGCIRHEVGRSLVGTPAFMSPEVFARNFSYKTDIWSLGITLYWLYTKCFPYTTRDLKQMEMKELSDIINDTPFCMYKLFSLSPLGFDFVTSCMQKKERYRLSVDQALQHPWIKNSRKRVYL